jgi:Cellulase (glycosyl hydrolase family 5)
LHKIKYNTYVKCDSVLEKSLALEIIGLNFHGYGSAVYQNRPTPLPPTNYIRDSFRTFADNGITCIRVTFYWESWELDATQFHEDLNAIAEAADEYGIKCIYDNHQWECSSWIGNGIGMPNSLMSSYYEKSTVQHEPDYNIKKDFWNKWWNRKIKSKDGIDGWDAQLSYLKSVAKLLNTRKSTFGFEILNEPEIFSISHYVKVGLYHNYAVKELRKITNKPILFCWALPHREVIDTSILQALTRPITRDNVIYDGHSFPPSVARIIYFKSIALMMGNIPLYIGEFNSGFTKGATLKQEQISEYMRRFKRFGVYGCALWRWSYIQDQNVSAFNLTRVVDNKIQPETNFKCLINALKEVKN